MKQQYNRIGAVALFAAGVLALSACGGASSQAPSEAIEPSSSAAAEVQPVESQPIVSEPTVVGGELGFAIQLPAMLEGNSTQEVSTYDVYGETVTTLRILYTGAGDPVNVLTFDEMSAAVWEKTKAEGGPTGTELGTSEAGRVIVFYSLQSNPFEEGTDAFTLFQEFPALSGEMLKSFAFVA